MTNRPPDIIQDGTVRCPNGTIAKGVILTTFVCDWVPRQRFFSTRAEAEAAMNRRQPLQAYADRILAILHEVSNDDIPEVRALVEEHICLSCGRDLPAGSGFCRCHNDD